MQYAHDTHIESASTPASKANLCRRSLICHNWIYQQLHTYMTQYCTMIRLEWQVPTPLLWPMRPLQTYMYHDHHHVITPPPPIHTYCAPVAHLRWLIEWQGQCEWYLRRSKQEGRRAKKAKNRRKLKKEEVKEKEEGGSGGKERRKRQEQGKMQRKGERTGE